MELKSTLEKDLKIISGDFIYVDLPDDKKFVLNYCHNKDDEIVFVYLLLFGSYKQFVQHTGIFFSERGLYSRKNKLKKLLKAKERLMEEFSEESIINLGLLETGKLSKREINKLCS